MTPTEAITALEKALEAGPSLSNQIMNLQCDSDDCAVASVAALLAYKSGHRDARHAAAELAAGQEAVIRTLLDAHAGALRDAARLDWLLENPNVVCEDAGNEWFTLDADCEPTYFKTGRDAIDAARAALATNTKGAV